MSGDCDKIPCPTCESGTTIPATGWACRYSDLTACGKHGNLCARCIEDRADARAVARMAAAFLEAGSCNLDTSAVSMAMSLLRLAREAGRKP